MTDEQMIELVRENERLKEALRSIARYAENAAFGSWRRFVFGTAKNALSAGKYSALLFD